MSKKREKKWLISIFFLTLQQLPFINRHLVMKKYVLTFCMLVMAMSLYAQQNSKKWVDPFSKPGAPGYEEMRKSKGYMEVGDIQNHLKYLLEACQKDNHSANYNLAIYLLSGVKDYLKADTALATQTMLYAAQNNYAPAQYAISLYIYNGIIPGQESYAAQMLIKSATQGYLPAKTFLANCYLVGRQGIKQDQKKGLAMTEECAVAGDANSQFTLAMCYYSGLYGNKDFVKAAKWFNAAADKGQWKSYNYLAYMYAKGEGVKKDFQKAHELIGMAKIRGEQAGELTKDAEAELLDSDGEIYLMEGKQDEALVVWKRLKETYPQFVERNKFELQNIFVRTMYQDEEANQSALASGKPSKVPVSDVDRQIPENTIVASPTFAVIIANENYREVDNVPFALHDGETFKQYCEKTLGIPPSNIKYIPDATLNNISRQVSWLTQVMDVYQGEANILFYYAGHGIPDEKSKSAYLLPTDGVGNDVSTGYNLDKLYSDLSSKPAKSVMVILDACFSGAKRDGKMLVSARGVAIKAKQNAPKGNMVVLSAAQGDETAYPYKEKGHGIFTYYLLKKLQETKGNITFGQLADYVTLQVKKHSVVINGKIQTPTVSPSTSATDWKEWKLR